MGSRVRTYVASGMTCDHCRLAVVREVSAVPGDDAPSVDLAQVVSPRSSETSWPWTSKRWSARRAMRSRGEDAGSSRLVEPCR
jgi:hypothetical protein